MKLTDVLIVLRYVFNDEKNIISIISMCKMVIFRVQTKYRLKFCIFLHYIMVFCMITKVSYICLHVYINGVEILKEGDQGEGRH
jgi:hypothetical protein